MGVKSDDGYSPIGWVGTGFSDSDLVNLTNDLERMLKVLRVMSTFLPRVVLQVSADVVTRDSDGNIGLRFPRVTRIRDDKFAQDVNTLEEVERMI